MLAFFQKGGVFMYPILFVFLTGMAVAVERWFQLTRIRSLNRKTWNTFYPMLAKGEFDKVKTINPLSHKCWIWGCRAKARPGVAET